MDKRHNQAKMNADAYEKLSSTIFEDESNLEADKEKFFELLSTDCVPKIKLTPQGTIMFLNT